MNSNLDGMRKLDTFDQAVHDFGAFLGDLKVEAKDHQVPALLLAAQCQDFSVGLLSLKNSLLLSSRLTLLRGFFEAAMRLNYIAVEGKSGALNLEFTDLKARVSKFKIAQQNCQQLQAFRINEEERRLNQLEREECRMVKFSDVLKKIIGQDDSEDYWMYRYWSGFAHSDFFELNLHAKKAPEAVPAVTSLIFSPEEVAEIYEYATSMLVRARNCLTRILPAS